MRIDLIFTMQELFRILKPNGCLFLSTPNVRSWVGIKNFFFKKKVQSCSTDIFLEYSKLKTLGHMGHVREYTSAEIKVFLRKMGFVIEETIYRGSYETFPGNCIIRFNPRLRPFFTCIARKPFE